LAAVERGRVAPADRQHLASWLASRLQPAGQDAHFALEGCTGWRYVAEELAAAGVTSHLGEPAETAFARGPKKHAKTDRADTRLLRDLPAGGRLPECWIPPGHILECRALYHDLRTEHTAQAQLRDLVPPGCPAADRAEPARRPGRAARGRRRAPVAGRPAAGDHRLGGARNARNATRYRAAAAAGHRSLLE
jgi:hypothetical protein